MIAMARHIIDRELDAVKQLTRELERGSLIKHADIESATGLKHDVTPWPKLIRSWKNWMMDERRISISSVPGVGYRLDTETEQLSHALRIEKQGVKRTVKAGMTAGVLPPESLDEPSKEIQASIVQRSNATRKEFNEVIAVRRSLLSKQETLPRLEMSGVR